MFDGRTLALLIMIFMQGCALGRLDGLNPEGKVKTDQCHPGGDQLGAGVGNELAATGISDQANCGAGVGNALYYNKVYGYQVQYLNILDLDVQSFEEVYLSNETSVSEEGTASSLSFRVPPNLQTGLTLPQLLQKLQTLPQYADRSWSTGVFNDLEAIISQHTSDPFLISEYVLMLKDSNHKLFVLHIESKIHIQTGSLVSTALQSFSANKFVTLPHGLPEFTQLPTRIINDVFVSSDGTIYAATNGGLSLSTDNGLTYSTKTTKDGLGDNHINDVEVDKEGRVYVATRNGISVSLDAGNTFTNHLPTGLLPNPMARICGINPENGWVVVSGWGSLMISTNGGKTFTTTRLPIDARTFACFYRDSQIYILTHNNLFVFDDKNPTLLFQREIHFGQQFIYDIYVTEQRHVYIGTSGGAFITYDTNETPFLSLFQIPDDNVYRIGENQDGELVFAMESGFSILNPKTNILTAAVITDPVTNFFQAETGIYYLCTSGGLIHTVLQHCLFPLSATLDTWVIERARDIAIDSRGFIYVASLDGFFISYDDGRTFEWINSTQVVNAVTTSDDGYVYASSLGELYVSQDGYDFFIANSPTINIENLTTDADGNLYVTDRRRAYRSRDHGQTFETLLEYLSLSHGAIHVDAGGTIFAAANKLVYRSYDDGNTFDTLLAPQSPTSIYTDIFDNLFVGNMNGLSKLNDDNQTFDNSLLNEHITDITHHEGTMYISTLNGLLMTVDGGQTFTKLTVQNGLPSQFVRAVDCDKNGNVYVATTSGIARLTID